MTDDTNDLQTQTRFEPGTRRGALNGGAGSTRDLFHTAPDPSAGRPTRWSSRRRTDQVRPGSGREARWTERWLSGHLFHAEPDPARGLLDRHPAAQRHRRPAHGPRPERHHPGRAHALPPHARRQRLLAAGHRPRRHRHPERGGEAAARRGPDAKKTSAATSSSGASGSGASSTAHHHRAAQAPGLRLRLRARALHPRRGLRARRRQGLRRPSTTRATSTGTIHGQLVPALRHGDQRPRGGATEERRPALPRALRAAGRRRRSPSPRPGPRPCWATPPWR